MGGAGSGTWIRTDTRSTLESRQRLGVWELLRRGVLQPGVSCEVGWSGGSLAGDSLRLTCQVDSVVLEYRIRAGGADWRFMRQVIPLDWTPCAVIGGKQVWLKCPCCYRRAVLVYLSGYRGFVCRLCTGAIYRSQTEDREARLSRKLRRIRARIGAEGIDSQQSIWHVPKPKGMHWRTFEQVLDRAEEVRVHALEEWNLKLERSLSKWAARLLNGAGG